jgi:pantoate--beta-alanine ligase
MKVVETVSDLRAELAPARSAGRTIGLVPTMGALHAGHLSLIREARRRCDVVVVSLFVNPAQFNDPADLSGYPREEKRDLELTAEEGIDYLFRPRHDEVYPAGFATTVSVASTTDRLEGAARGRSHFDGVTTVVAKLFNMVGPDVAYFGAKDAQQAVVVRQMVSDLNLPLTIQVCPTVRDPDGLALSSRNGLLSAKERERAVALPRALAAIMRAAGNGERDPQRLRQMGLAVLTEAAIEPEYLEIVDPGTLEPVSNLGSDVLVLAAARVGATRLIDNTLIQAPAPAAAAVTANEYTGASE